jgi:UDP-N-acetylglucosamine transferase subunit ALG13
VSALVLALAGTDHHPFDRLVHWLDVAAARRSDVRVLVQHGSAIAPYLAEGHAFLPHDRLSSLIEQATVVVCHGGPGTIMDARQAGHVPLCVPRDPRLGEHVDDHQQRFVDVVAEVGLVQRVSSLNDLLVGIDGRLALDTVAPAVDAFDQARHAALEMAARELDHLAARRRPRVPRPRRSRVALSGRR